MKPSIPRVTRTKPKRKRLLVKWVTVVSAFVIGLAAFTGALDNLYRSLCRWTHWCSDETRAIAYLDWDSKPWRAEIKDEKFVIAAKDSLGNTQIVPALRYLTWDRSPWEAVIHYGSFVHSPGGDSNRSHPDDVLHYLDWSERPQTLRIHEANNTESR